MANVTCPVCGKELPDGAKFCTSCGAKISTPEIPATLAVPDIPAVPETPVASETPIETEIPAPQPEFKPEPPQPRFEPAPAPSHPEYRPEPPRNSAQQTPMKPPKSEYDLISTWGIVGIFFLLMIPVVNLILIIMWACGGCRKIQKQSFARAMLIIAAFMLVVSIILCTVLVVAIGELYEANPDMSPEEFSEYIIDMIGLNDIPTGMVTPVHLLR